MDTSTRYLFETLPLITAIAAIFFAGYRSLISNNLYVRTDSFFTVLLSILLIAAQVSWSWTYFIKKDLIGTDNANLMWTAFNILVMLKFTYTAYWADKR